MIITRSLFLSELRDTQFWQYGLRQHKVSLLFSLVLAVEKLSWEVQQLKENMSYSPLVQSSISVIRNKCSSAQEKGYTGYTP